MEELSSLINIKGCKHVLILQSSLISSVPNINRKVKIKNFDKLNKKFNFG